MRPPSPATPPLANVAARASSGQAQVDRDEYYSVDELQNPPAPLGFSNFHSTMPPIHEPYCSRAMPTNGVVASRRPAPPAPADYTAPLGDEADPPPEFDYSAFTRNFVAAAAERDESATVATTCGSVSEVHSRSGSESPGSDRSFDGDNDGFGFRIGPHEYLNVQQPPHLGDLSAGQAAAKLQVARALSPARSETSSMAEMEQYNHAAALGVTLTPSLHASQTSML